MKELQDSEAVEKIEEEVLPGPQGIGMAVAFSWGLAVQILLTPIITTFFSQSTMMKVPGISPALSTILSFVIALIVGVGLILFGEMVRSGHNWARRVQIVANALLFLGGLISLVNLYQSVKAGDFWPIITEVILVIFSPLIVWRLSRPVTARWFQAVTATAARKRHGGMWVVFIALWAIVGGVLQTLATIK